MTRTICRTPLLALAGTLLATAALAQATEVTTYEVEAPFEQVRQDVADAIINRGYVIDYNAKIGDMLARTAGDVGATKEIYAGAETMQFCSAVLSRKTMEADPKNIAYCPYAIFVYATPDAPGTVTVGFRPLGGDAAGPLSEVDALLDEIAREAAGEL